MLGLASRPLTGNLGTSCLTFSRSGAARPAAHGGTTTMASTRELRGTKGSTRAKPKARSRAKVSVKKSATTRRGVRSKTAPAAKARPRQTFNVSHHRAEDFQGGLRRYAKYRDLGMSKATGGMVQAHVIRMIPPCDPKEVSKRHYHDVDLQLVYVLKGWIKSEFEGEGEVTMRAGSCWLQPPRIKHSVLDYSDDCELLEIILPAEFETVTLE
jgi:mannose-6-phosphate isomerase-like protein (cupin superfamily)